MASLLNQSPYVTTSGYRQDFVEAPSQMVRGRPEPTATWFALWPRFMPLPHPAPTIPEASFGHLMGGYEAGYYGYLWAMVYAQDMFTRFQREGVLSPRTGRAYREGILAAAGTEEPDTLVQRFLGRPVNYERSIASLV